MTDYKQLCAELVDAIDSGISTDRMHSSPLVLRARAALAEPKPPNRMVLTDSRSVLTKKSLQALVDFVVPHMLHEANTYTNEAIRLNRMSIRKQLLDFY